MDSSEGAGRVRNHEPSTEGLCAWGGSCPWQWTLISSWALGSSEGSPTVKTGHGCMGGAAPRWPARCVLAVTVGTGEDGHSRGARREPGLPASLEKPGRLPPRGSAVWTSAPGPGFPDSVTGQVSPSTACPWNAGKQTPSADQEAGVLMVKWLPLVS